MEVLSILPSTHYPLYDFDLRATHARTLLPAALASVSFGFVLVRVRVRTNTNPNGTEANAAGRSGNARALHASQNCKENSAYKVLLRLLRNNFFCILYLPVSLLMPDPRSLFQNKTNEDR